MDLQRNGCQLKVFFEFHQLYCISVLFQVRSLSSASLTTVTGDLQTQVTERNTRTSTQGETSQCCFLNTSISSDKPNNISVAAFFAVINRITAKCEAATSPTPTHPLSGDFLLFLDFHLFKSHVPSINAPFCARKHMKVHGKDAVCQFDSSESEEEEESSAASPSSSLVSAPPSYLPAPSPSSSSHGQGVPVSQADWYL